MVPPPTQSGSGRFWLKLSLGLALVSSVVSGLVFAQRGASAIQATAEAPGVAITSGCEEESLFALWRAVQGQPVYLDATRLPYASAYFNWLFYAGYTIPVGAAVRLSGDASMIPLAGRLTTAVVALAGAAGLFLLLRRVLGGQGLIAAGLATFVFFGPTVGWWAHTLRPDVGALALETAAIMVLLLNYRSHPRGAAGLAGLLFYGAWSFKQTYFFGLGAMLLFLCWRRQWRSARWLSFTSVGLWIATFALLGPAYRAAFLGTVTTNVYYLDLGWANLRDLLVKSAPLWLLLGAAGWLHPRLRPPGPIRPLAADAMVLGALGLLVAAPLAFMASCKHGASSYYYFTTLVMLSLLAAGLVASLTCHRLVATAFGLATVMQFLVLFGYAGKISLTQQCRELNDVWTVWQKQAEPRFACLYNLNLPWLNPNSPPLVLAYNYELDRAAGRTFEKDGIGGLITAGYFRSLLLPANTGQRYDGGTLQLYDRGETINGMTLFYRQPSSTK